MLSSEKKGENEDEKVLRRNNEGFDCEQQAVLSRMSVQRIKISEEQRVWIFRGM